MFLPPEEKAFLESVAPPPHEELVKTAEKFLVLTGWSVTDLAEGIRHESGRCGRHSLLLWFRGKYLSEHTRISTTRFMDARVWDYIHRHWPQRRKLDAPAQVLHTQAFEDIRDAFEHAFESGVNALIQGPPSSEKSECLQYLVAQRQSQSDGTDDAIYIKCDPTLQSPLPFLRRLCREAGVMICRTVVTDDYLLALVDNFRQRERLPVLVIDEAQELPVRVLNTLRGLHEHTRRRAQNHAGCAFILAGSHDLAAQFEHPRTRGKLSQLSSRIPRRIHLTGMTDEEALQIAARAYGSGGRLARLSETQQKSVLKECRDEDPFTPVCANAKCSKVWQRSTSGVLAEKCKCGSNRSRPLVYNSPRRLLGFIAQERRARLRAVSTPRLEDAAG